MAEKDGTNTKCKNSTCPFQNKEIDDIRRIIDDRIENHLQNRSLTYKEIKTLTQVFQEIVDVAVNRHKVDCPMRDKINELSKSLEKMKGEQSGRDKAKSIGSMIRDNIIQIIVAILVLASLIITIIGLII